MMMMIMDDEDVDDDDDDESVCNSVLEYVMCAEEANSGGCLLFIFIFMIFIFMIIIMMMIIILHIIMDLISLKSSIQINLKTLIHRNIHN